MKQVGLKATLSFGSCGVVTELFTSERAQRLLGEMTGWAGGEKWTKIPWMIDLWEARSVAVREGKPIFAWAKNGHPLGST